jgi:hypothetical protein
MPPETDTAPVPAPQAPAEPSTPSGEPEFPAETPLSEMTLEQREAYWKHQAKVHETAWKKRAGDLTPEKVQELRDKAARHDALERELMSDKDKAVAEARDAAKAEALASVTPRLVAAEFKAAAAGRVEPARLATILEPLDLSKFLNGDEVDTDKVAAFVDGIAPATAPQPKGPTSTGQGRRESSTGPSVASGRDLYRAQRGKK